MSQAPRILYCHCTYADVLPLEVKLAVFRQLAASGAAFHAVADLCELAARKDPRLQRIAESPGVRIAACFPRAVRWLFRAGGAPLPSDGVDVFNMRAQSADEVLAGLLRGPTLSGGTDAALRCRCHDNARAPAAENTHARRVSDAVEANDTAHWIPWFPVIDYDRCGQCKQCLSFCLFGVYAVGADERVEVRNPTHCKTNCPACARVCPNVAIIFPKYDKAPINGDEVREEDVRHDAVKVDAAGLFEGGVRATLRARGEEARRQFAAETVDSGGSGERERRMKIQTDLDIPDEVLASVMNQAVSGEEVESNDTKDEGQAVRPKTADDRRSSSAETVWDI